MIPRRVLTVVFAFIGTLMVPGTASAGDVVFDSGVSSQLETRRTPGGLLLVRPRFDGEAVGWFLFDTAAAHCIDKSLADRVGFPTGEKIISRTALALVPSVRRLVGRMQLGPAMFDDVVMTEVDLSSLSEALGEDIAGLVGIEVMDACIVEVDRRAGRIELFEPALHEQELEVWHPVIRRHTLACIEVTIDGQVETLKIDTGLDAPVLIYPAAAKRLGLLEGRVVGSATGETVGGATEFSVVMLSSLRIGSVTLGGVPALVSRETAGSMSDDQIAGLLGGQILDEFTLVMDLPHERVGFVLHEPDGAR